MTLILQDLKGDLTYLCGKRGGTPRVRRAQIMNSRGCRGGAQVSSRPFLSRHRLSQTFSIKPHHRRWTDHFLVFAWVGEWEEGSEEFKTNKLRWHFGLALHHFDIFLKRCPELEDLAFKCWYHATSLLWSLALTGAAVGKRQAHFLTTEHKAWVDKIHTFTGNIKTYHPLKVLRL